MNEKFYSLPAEKQKNMINAGFRVFSQNSYKKSPMSEIADAAGISKSLLFHYFHNKKELYLFLWEEAARITMQYLNNYNCYEQAGLFEMMERGMKAKLHMMELYPDLAAFAVKSFYEKDPAVSEDIRKIYQKHFDLKAIKTFSQLDPSEFRPGLDLKMMHREMYLASEGYLWELMRRGESLDAKKLERDFSKLLAFWKEIYANPNKEESE